MDRISITQKLTRESQVVPGMALLGGDGTFRIPCLLGGPRSFEMCHKGYFRPEPLPLLILSLLMSYFASQCLPAASPKAQVNQL
jgi:hypothetical protein